MACPAADRVLFAMLHEKTTFFASHLSALDKASNALQLCTVNESGRCQRVHADY